MRRVVLLLALIAGCRAEGGACRFEIDCQKGSRCAFEDPTSPTGRCVECPLRETPYDGIDNDCKPSTPDDDLDGDGARSTESEVAPGTDCDDHDPAVGPGAPERCGNRVDDDCDGETDEPDCADLLPPEIHFDLPTFGGPVRGTAFIVVRVTDDYAVRGADLSFDGTPLVSVGRDRDDFRFVLDTNLYPDGPYALDATAVDAGLHFGRARALVYVDNHTKPTVAFLTPGEGAFGGEVSLTASAEDYGLIREVRYRLGGLQATAIAPPYEVRIDTKTMLDGPHTLEAIATDDAGDVGRIDRVLVIDNSAPVVYFDPPFGVVLEGRVKISARAVDSSGISSLRLNGQLVRDDHLELAIDTRTLPNGPLLVQFEAADRADVGGEPNRARGHILYVVRNPEPPRPQVSIEAPSVILAGLGGELRAQASAAKAITRLELELDGRRVATASAAAARFPLSITATGTPALRVRAIDAAGAEGVAGAALEVLPGGRFARQSSPIGRAEWIAARGAEVAFGAPDRVVVWSSTLSEVARLEAPEPLAAFVLADLDGAAPIDVAFVTARGRIGSSLDRRALFAPIGARPPLAVWPGRGRDRVAFARPRSIYVPGLGDLPTDGPIDELVGSAIGLAYRAGDRIAIVDGPRLRLPGARRLYRSGAGLSIATDRGLFAWDGATTELVGRVVLGPRSAAGDLNGDGRTDYVDLDGSVEVWFGAIDGLVGPFAVEPGGRAIAVAAGVIWVLEDGALVRLKGGG